MAYKKTILLSTFGQIQIFFYNGLLAFNNASHHQHSLSNYLHIFLFSYITAYIEQFYFFIFTVVICANMAPIFMLGGVSCKKIAHINYVQRMNPNFLF